MFVSALLLHGSKNLRTKLDERGKEKEKKRSQREVQVAHPSSRWREARVSALITDHCSTH
jgi:hypothetical protein